MEVKYKRADELDCGDVIINDGMETVVESVEVVSGYIRINKKEVLTPPEAQLRLVCRSPSDLEIVQKALKTVGKYGGTLVFQDDGSCLIYEYPKMTDPHVIGFAECSNLLTWAKQRIGVA